MGYFKQNAFSFRLKLQAYLKEHIGEFPKQLNNEEEIIGRIAKAKTVKFTAADLLALIS